MSLARLFKSILSIFLLALPLSSQAGSRVFYDDFESGNTNKWQFPGTYDHAIVVTTAYDGGRPHGGARMLEGNWNGTIDYTDPRKNSYATLLDWNYTNEFLIRFWVRLDRDVDRKNGSKLFRLGTVGTNMYYIGAQMHETPGQMFMFFESMAGVSGGLTYSGGVIGDNNWHKVEIYVRHNTPGQTNGITRVWTDGVMVLNGVNVRSVSDGGNWKPMNLMSNWSNNPGWEHDANNHAYWDDIEIFSDANTGTVMTGRMDDATAQSSGGGGNPPQAPRSPTNLRLLP